MISSGEEYVDSLRGRKLNVYLFGELIQDPVEHPIIKPSINALAKTYDLANENPDLATAVSPYTNERIISFPCISCTSTGMCYITWVRIRE